MKVVIIYAHPNLESFNGAILEQVKRGLSDGNHTYEVIDLYADKFNPVLIYDENRKRSELKNDPETAHYRQLIQDADHLIFIYPIWWQGLPAILKGFLDRVFVSGFAYTNKGRMPEGLLKGKSAWVVYTLDAPSWYVRLFRGSSEWRVMKGAVLNYCGIRNVKRMMFASTVRSSQERRQNWLKYVYSQARGRIN